MQNKSVQTTPPEPAKAAAAAQHNLILENRHLATATGIKRIVSYDDTAASLETSTCSSTDLTVWMDSSRLFCRLRDASLK